MLQPATLDIAAKFGVEFFKRLVGDVMKEAGLGWIVPRVLPLGALLTGGPLL